MRDLRSFDIGSRVITDFSFPVAALPECVTREVRQLDLPRELQLLQLQLILLHVR